MNHDYCHCFDFDDKKCPKDCFRAQLERDLMKRYDLVGIPMTYGNLKGTEYCPMEGNK